MGLAQILISLNYFRKRLKFLEAKLDYRKGVIIQNKTELNFTDLIKLFTPKTPRTQTRRPYLAIKIEKGIIFTYREDVTPINYFIKDVDIESPGKRWNADTMAVKFSFLSETGSGNAKGNFTINFKTMDYRLSAFIQKYDLNIIEQYLKEMVNYELCVPTWMQISLQKAT